LKKFDDRLFLLAREHIYSAKSEQGKKNDIKDL